jgi:hypothetical protein
VSGQRFGIDELRAARNIFSHCSETFNQRFTAEQLIAIARASHASEWDTIPDTWTEEQIAAALRGVAPAWDRETGEPGGGDEKVYLTEPLIKVLRAIVYSGAEGVAGMSTATFSEHVEELIRRGALDRGPHVFATDDGLAALRQAEAEVAARDLGSTS